MSDDLNCGKAEEEGLRGLPAWHRAVLEGLPDAVLVLDTENHVVFANQACAELFGAPLSWLRGDMLTSIAPVDRAHEFEFGRSENDRRTIECRRSKIEFDGQHFVLVTLRDVTDVAVLRGELFEQSITDDLTGLLNRRGFYGIAEPLIERARRGGFGPTILLADLNGLKSLNDSLGHAVGDVALVQAAESLRECFRAPNVVGRIGGDEFAVLMPAATSEEVQQKLKELQDRIQLRNHSMRRVFELSLSTGVASFEPRLDGGLDDILLRADTALYADKRKHAPERLLP